MNSYYTYILASHRFGTLYTGVTNDLVRRTYEHKEGLVEGFTSRYVVKLLVWYEVHATILAAIQREKNIKHWSRDWKIQLIEKMNLAWNDLYDEISG
jgi:putative endonuclease